MEGLKLVRATEEHYRGILDISRDVYDGIDYLPALYADWLRQEREHEDWRRNLVLLDADGKVIGFQSFLLQDGGRRVIAQALRVDSTLRGRGVGAELIRGSLDLLRETGQHQELIELKTVWHRVMSWEKAQDEPAVGKLCGSRILRCYQIPENLAELCKKISTEPDLALEETDHRGLGEIYARDPEGFAKRFLLCGKYFLINWIPYYVDKKEDFERMTSFESGLTALYAPGKDKDAAAPSSLSVLSLPWSTSRGRVTGIDLFAAGRAEFRAHALAQLLRVGQVMDEVGVGAAGSTDHVWVIADEPFAAAVDELFEGELRLPLMDSHLYSPDAEDRKRPYGERRIPRYYMFEKKLSTSNGKK